jgi:fructose-1,6-bisphosphatase/sedoheptulose 1,7-bisphosphatase-like protein
LLDGVRVSNGVATTHTLILNSFTRTMSELRVRQPV